MDNPFVKHYSRNDNSIRSVGPSMMAVGSFHTHRALVTLVLLVMMQAGVDAAPKAEIGDCPSLCRCLEKGSVITCHRAGLHRLPDLLSTTMFLDFDHNHIAVIRNRSFVNTPRLEMISFQDNQIQDIVEGSFAGLANLRTLLLRKNLISSLPPNIFSMNIRLEILDLSQNLFTIIPDYILHSLHSLRSFNLSYNRLDSPHLGSGFQYTKQLRVLDVTGNNFVSLEQRAFKVLKRWDQTVEHSLNLSFCNIHHIHGHTLLNILNLDTLSLAGNPAIPPADLQASIEDLATSKLRDLNLAGLNLSDIYRFFRSFQHPHLQYLNLAYNKIQTIRRGTFYYLEELKHIDLSHNLVRSIEDFASLSKLTTLDLSYNLLHFIDPMSLESLHSLQSLDLSHNSLTQLDDEPFLYLFDLRLLDISYNKVSRMLITSGMESLQTLKARNNILSDLSFVAQLRHLQSLDLGHNAVQQLGPSFLPRGQHMLVLNASENNIHQIHTNTFHMSTQDVVDLSGNQLSSISNPGWSDIKKLYLNRNILYNLTANTFSGLRSLEELYLGWNHLIAFSRGTFEELVNLRVLDLQHNPLGTFLSLYDAPVSAGLDSLTSLQVLYLSHVDLHVVSVQLLANMTALTSLDLSSNYLTSLTTNTFSHLRHLRLVNLADNQIPYVDPQIFHVVRDLKLLDLSANPFDCTCELMPFRSWAISTLSDQVDVTVVNLHDTGKYRCLSPPEWKGVPLLNFHLDSSSCSTQEHVVILAAIACILLALSLTIIIGVLRYKWWRRHKETQRTTVVQEYTFVDDSSTAALTGNQTLSMNNTTQTIKEWV